MEHEPLKLELENNENSPYLILPSDKGSGIHVRPDGSMILGKAMWFTFVQKDELLIHRNGIIEQRGDTLAFQIVHHYNLPINENSRSDYEGFLERIEQAKPIDHYELMDILDEIE